MPRGEQHGGKPIKAKAKMSGYRMHKRIEGAKAKAQGANSVPQMREAFDDLAGVVEALVQQQNSK